MACTIFLSYATADRPRALEVRALLSEHHTVFMDSASLVGGAEWPREIEDALTACEAVVVLCSAAAWEPRRWVRKELRFARERDKPVIPVLLEGTLPLELVDCHFVDGRVGIAEYGVDLLAAVAVHVRPPERDQRIDRLLGETLRAQLAANGAEAAARYRDAAAMDATLPRSLAELWARVAGPPAAPSVGLADLGFVLRGERLAISEYADGRATYRWSVAIDATRDILARIAYVRYDLRSYYASGLRLVRDRETGFQLAQLAWAPVAFKVEIVLLDGATLHTWVDITLRDQRVPAPTEPFPLDT